MKDKFEILLSTLFVRTPNKFQNIKSLWVVLEFQGHKVNEGHIWDFLYALTDCFCKNYLINSIISSIFERHFKSLVNEGKISNFLKHFTYKNFMMNFKISKFVGSTG